MRRLITDASLRGGGRYAIVLEEDRRIVHQEVGALPGRADNSMYAEARALRLGLRRARGIGWDRFLAVTDNKNVVAMVQRGRTRFWRRLREWVHALQATLLWRRREHVEPADKLLREHDALVQVVAAAFRSGGGPSPRGPAAP